MQVRRSQSGWDVVDQDGKVLASFVTNKEAWRFIDLRSGEPMNRSQRVTEWLNDKWP